MFMKLASSIAPSAHHIQPYRHCVRSYRAASLPTSRTLHSSSSTDSSSTAPHQTSSANGTRSFTSINCNTPYNLCFVRHGQSTWNRDNRFIGWTDTPLTEDGVLEARVAGRMLRASGMMFDEAHTSLLRRSIRTVNLVLMEIGQEYIPVQKHWRLNERSYGDLVGLNKKEVVKQFGADQVKRWRRSYDEPPPLMRDDHEHHPMRDPRYRLVSVLIVAVCRTIRMSRYFCIHATLFFVT